jgi:hypothetical protein
MFSANENPIVFSKDAKSGVADCVGVEAEDVSMKGMDEILRKVAEVGYAAVDEAAKDKRAKHASERSVVGVVTCETIAPGLDKNAVFSEEDSVVVATLQSMRPLLAERLLKRPKQDSGTGGST